VNLIKLWLLIIQNWPATNYNYMALTSDHLPVAVSPTTKDTKDFTLKDGKELDALLEALKS
jgi:hypothetical protein